MTLDTQTKHAAAKNSPADATAAELRALVAAQRRLDASLRAGGIATWIMDVPTLHVYGDSNLARWFGVEADDGPLERYVAAVHPDDRPGVQTLIGTALESGETYAAEYRLTTGGRERWVLARGAIERDAAGRPLRMNGAVLDVTDRRRAEEAMRQGEASFRQLADAMPQIVFTSRPDGFVDYFNDKWYEFTGQPRGGVGGDESWTAVIHPDDLQRTAEGWAAAMAAGDLYEIEYRFRRGGDGAYRWHLGRALPVRDEAGRIVRWFGTATDIHDRKTTETALGDSEARLADVMRTALDCVIGMDHHGRVTDWNPAAESTFGWTHDEAVGQELAAMVIPPALRERHRAGLANFLVGGEGPVLNKRLELSAVRRGGEEFPVELTIARMATEPPSFTGFVRDITDRRRAEATLRESEARYRGLFESIDQGFCVIELIRDAAGRAVDYRYVEINPAFEQQTGFRDAVGRTINEMVADMEPFWNEVYDRVARTGEPARFENEAAQMGRWYDVFAFRAGGEGSRRVAILFKDITADKRADREREQLLEAERAARTEAERASNMKDEFLATLSHELRTPLNAILGWSQILRTGGADAADVAEAVDVIERNARAQTQIIEDLLDMSRIISGKIRLDVQEVDLEAVVRAAIETVKPAAEAKNIRVVPVLDPLAHPVSGDPNRLQQVFWNLLSNAVKFSPKGGRVQVLLKRINSHLEVDIIDTGEGIEPQFLPFVFDRFRQADATTTRAHGGLGLGLAIVKQLVELHGGTVRAKSGGKGQGTTFAVMLPVTVLHPDPDPEPVRRHPRGDGATVDPAACAKLAGVKVLVVDDEPDARGLVRRLLSDCHAEVSVAGSAAEAMRRLQEDVPDVLVSDIGMPGEDGYALIRRVRDLPDREGGDVPAIALTAYARAEDRVKVLTAGYHMHLAKPVEPAELITVVASLASRFAKRPAH